MSATEFAIRAVKFAKHASAAARKQDHKSAQFILNTAFKYNPDPYFAKCLSLALKYEDRAVAQQRPHTPARKK